MRRVIEVKITKKYNPVNVRNHHSGGFILSDGMIVNASNHDGLCKSIGCSLQDAIQSGLCRFASHTGQQGKIIAFEYCKLTVKQKVAIKIMLKLQDYFTVVTTKDTVSKFRPIRKITF